MITIRNKKTGEVKQIEESEKANYLSPKPVATNDPQVQFQQAWNQAPDLATKNKVASSYKTAFGRDLFAESDLNAAQKKVKEQNDTLKNKAQAVLTILDAKKSGSLAGKAYEDALNAAAAEFTSYRSIASEAGGGKNLTANELAILAGANPRIETRTQNVVDKLTGRIPPQSAKVLDDEETLRRKMTLAVRGFTAASPEEQQKIIKEYSDLSANTNNEKSIGGLVGNAAGDVGEIINSILGIPAQAIQMQKEHGSLTPALLRGDPAALQTLIGASTPAVPYAGRLNEIAGNPIEGGDIAGRIGEQAYQNPVRTLLDLLPILGATKAFRGGQTVPVTDSVAPAGASTRNPLVVAADVIKGGGSKDYVSRAATREGALPQNQVLMEEKILTKPSTTGQVKASAVSLDKFGNKLNDLYTSSSEVFTGNEIKSILENGLKDKGYSPKDVAFIREYLNKQGSFNLKSGDTDIPVKNVWEAVKKIEKNPPKNTKSAEAAAGYKILSQEVGGILRKELMEKVPDVKPLNARYTAVKDYLDNVLNDPRGIALERGVVNTAAKAIQRAFGSVLNLGYSATETVQNKFLRDMRTKQGNPQLRK